MKKELNLNPSTETSTTEQKKEGIYNGKFLYKDKMGIFVAKPLAEIGHIEVIGNFSRLWDANKFNLRDWDSSLVNLGDIVELNGFGKPNQSNLLLLCKVKCFDKEKVYYWDGTEYDLSRKYKKEFIAILIKFWNDAFLREIGIAA